DSAIRNPNSAILVRSIIQKRVAQFQQQNLAGLSRASHSRTNIKKLIRGIHKFQDNVFGAYQALFQRLADGQQPETLLVTCSNSRINPHLLTQTARDERLNVAIRANVLVQLKNLKTHPAVAEGLSAGRLKLYGWVYQFETGDVFAYDPDAGNFASIRATTKG
ncbi:MAG: hypothetical protein MI725_10370, partial [Pirellulales bacterium]|nr:hypothetical protein [Pirellulales bacterium]